VFRQVTLPTIQSTPSSRTAWIADILGHKTSSVQAQDIFYENEDFVVVPDTKWDKKNILDMWCLAIVKDQKLKTLRDLNASHLPLLLSIRENTFHAIHQKYSTQKDQILAFVQYLPSFFHLHVHFTHYSKITAGRAVLLDDIIDNIQIKNDYYEVCAFTILVGDHMDLYKSIVQYNQSHT